MIGTSSQTIFNPAALNEIIELEKGGEKGLLLSLINDYQENSTKILQQISLEIARSNASQIEINVHSLKSSSALLGLEKLAALCQILEDSAEKQILPTGEEFKKLQAEHALALEALKKFIQLSESI